MSKATSSTERVRMPARPGSPLETGNYLLPRALTSFVPREQEEADLAELLQRDNVRLVSLTGPGGVGKTRLALHVCEHLQDSFERIWFVQLGSVADPSALFPTIAEQLRFDGVAIEFGRFDVLVAAISDSRSLLVLDNFEHLIEAASDLGKLLAAVRTLTVLATSRTVLHVSGEFEYRLAPLPVPPPGAIQKAEDLADFAAIRLFVERGEAADATFSLNKENIETVAAVCRFTDGLPLAIELAAGQLRTFSPESLLLNLDSRFTVLVNGPVDQPERLQSMWGAIAWSYELLTPGDRRAFRTASLFSDGFTLDAIHAVAGGDDHVPTIRSLTRLIEGNLVFRLPAVGSGSEARYAMLEVIREFALEQLRQEGEAEAGKEAHARYFLTLAEDAEPLLVISGSAIWVERLAIERANLRQAVDWTLRAGRSESVLRLAGTLLSMTYARGEPSESFSWLQQALANPGSATRELIADALFASSALAQVQGDLLTSNQILERSLNISRASSYRFGEARALIGLGIGAEWADSPSTSKGFYREALQVMSSVTGDDARLMHWRILPIANLADIALVERRLAEALDLGYQAVDAWRADGYLWGLAQALGTVAAAHCEQGDLSTSLAEYGEALDHWLACADGRGIAGTIAGIGGLALAAGQTEAGIRLLGAADAVRDQLHVKFVAHYLYTQQVTAMARSRIDIASFAELWNEGALLHVDEALSMTKAVLATMTSTRHQPMDAPLTRREFAVLRLVANGMHDREIADSLSISPRTVQSHVMSVLTKLGARSRSEAVAIGIRRGLI